MNKEEVINKINEMTVETFFSKTLFVQQKKVIELIEQLDEPEAGHADEAPRYVKNILARLRELPLHDRKVWLKAIMGEFEQDFSHAKWREGYEQGKLEGMVEREKVIIPQFVADWYEEHKDNLEYNIWDWMKYNLEPKKRENVIFSQWLGKTVNKPVETLIKMKLYGYEVEKKPKYTVKFKATKQYLSNDELGPHFDPSFRSNFTKSDLEKLGLSEVFNSPLFEVEEVEEW